MTLFENILGYLCVAILVIILLGGCTEEYRRAQEQKQIPVADQTVQAEVGGKRFHAAFHGEFKGGYDNNIRHIFIITDSTCFGKESSAFRQGMNCRKLFPFDLTISFHRSILFVDTYEHNNCKN